MKVSECVESICNFPVAYQGGKLTPKAIFENSGYTQFYKVISLASIRGHLRVHPELINKWTVYSADKRWSPAWAFYKDSNGTWVVAYIQEHGARGFEIIFDDEIDACTLMVRMEFEQLRLLNQ